MELTNKERVLMAHTVGMVENRPKKDWGKRNYFAASPGGENDWVLDGLVIHKMMTRGHRDDSLNFYHCTEAGMKAIGLHKAAIKRALEK